MKSRLALRTSRATLAALTALLCAFSCFGPVDNDNGELYSELVSVWQYLRVYSIYQDSSIYEGRIPDDPFVFDSAAALMAAVADTLRGSHYTRWNALGCVVPATFLVDNVAAKRRAVVVESLTVFVDTLTDSTARITITRFVEGEYDYGIGGRLFRWDSTSASFAEALPAVRSFPNLVIDLWNNGGGSINEAQAIVSMFLAANTPYLNAREREYDSTTRTARTLGWRPWVTKGGPREELSGKRVIIVMNESSASSSEIVIAALRECAGATLVGGRSYGKAIGQIKHFRRDRPVLQITYLQMRGLSERTGSYMRVGIAPDVVAEESHSEALLAAVRVNEPGITSLRPLARRVAAVSPVQGYKNVVEPY